MSARPSTSTKDLIKALGNGSNGFGWIKLLFGLLLALTPGLVGYGVLQANVSNNREVIRELKTTKANQDIVEQQYTTILNRFDRIENLLDKLASRP